MTARRFPALAAAALAMAATALAVVPAAARADDYPNRPIKLIVPFPPGGGNDNVARPIAQKLSDALGQQVIIDNRPGAGTMIGAEAAAHAAPDGYTLFLGSIASHAISPNLYARVPYDPIKDFEPVSLLASAPTLLVVNTHTPYKTLKDVLAAAKANPGHNFFGIEWANWFWRYASDRLRRNGCLNARTVRSDAAFFVRASPVAQVREVARAGVTMPAKSTSFSPKVPTGLLLNALDERVV